MMKYVGWSLTFVAYCFCIFSIKIFQAKDYKYNVPWETFYATASKPTWAAAVGWMIYASVRGFGGEKLYWGKTSEYCLSILFFGYILFFLHLKYLSFLFLRI